MNSFERPKLNKPESSAHSEEGPQSWPPKSFSPAEVQRNRDRWKAESGRIIEELDWEADPGVMEIYARANDRLEQLAEADTYTYEKHRAIMADETDRFVNEHPDRADQYRAQWEQWAEVAGVDPNINDREWEQLAIHQPSVAYIGQYRQIARAVYRQR